MRSLKVRQVLTGQGMGGFVAEKKNLLGDTEFIRKPVKMLEGRCTIPCLSSSHLPTRCSPSLTHPQYIGETVV